MSDIVPFLRARLDEDEQTARQAKPGPWVWSDNSDDPWLISGTPDLDDPDFDFDRIVLKGWGLSDSGLTITEPDKAHIARHDPARVLAEVDAKRRIIDEHGWSYADPYEEWKGDEYRAKWGDDRDKRLCTRCGGAQPHTVLGMVPAHVAWPCPTLRLLALPYASHPSYDEAWRP